MYLVFKKILNIKIINYFFYSGSGTIKTEQF